MVDQPREGDQPLPTPNDSIDIQTLVIRDIKNRRQVGIARYGTALQANNGRDALQDAYEESLDQTCYLRQLIEERRKYREGEAPSEVPDAAADARFWGEHPLAAPGTNAYDRSESDRPAGPAYPYHPEGHITVRGTSCLAQGHHVSEECVDSELNATMHYGQNKSDRPKSYPVHPYLSQGHVGKNGLPCLTVGRHVPNQCIEDESKAMMRYGENSRHFNREGSKCIVKEAHTQIQCVHEDQFANPGGI